MSTLEGEITHSYLEQEREKMYEAQLDIDRHTRIMSKAAEERNAACNRREFAARKIDQLLDEYYPIMPAEGVELGTE